MGNQQERSLAWLAGIVDGEGSVSFQVYTLPSGRVRITPFVCVVNSDEGILDETMRLLGELTAGHKGAKPRLCGKPQSPTSTGFESRLVCKTIRVDGTAVGPILEALLPHLRSKKANAARVVLQYLASRTAMLLSRDAQGRIERQGYTTTQIALVSSIRTSPLAKSSEAICRAPNVTVG